MRKYKYTVSWNNDGNEEFKGYDKYKDAEAKFRELDKNGYECTLTNSEEPLSSKYDFSDRLNKNLEVTKKKIPSMSIKELIKTWSNGYNPECLSLALQKIAENEDKYPKIAELFYKLQSELSNLAGIKMNFSERISKIFNFGKHGSKFSPKFDVGDIDDKWIKMHLYGEMK